MSEAKDIGVASASQQSADGQLQQLSAEEPQAATAGGPTRSIHISQLRNAARRLRQKNKEMNSIKLQKKISVCLNEKVDSMKRDIQYMKNMLRDANKVER